MASPPGSPPRVLSANRAQIELRTFDLEALLPAGHRARLIWFAVEQLDLQAFYDAIKARESLPGRPSLDPRVLLALWLYATSEAVGSARQLSRLCERDHAYQWICGGLRPNHHTLSDFRVDHGEKLDDLLTQLLATLMKQKLVTLKRVAQDGIRVRASAGASSFRRGSTLRERCLSEASTQVALLKKELEDDPSASTAREAAARQRAAREQEEAVKRALAELPDVQASYERNLRKRGKRGRKTSSGGQKSGPREGEDKGEARISTTDPEARVMKMGDGGFRPAYNVQFATDAEHRLVVGVDVSNAGTDMDQMVGMFDQVVRRTGEKPAEWLVDGGYTKLKAIDEVASHGTLVYAPVPAPRRAGINAHDRKDDDTDRSFEWRKRMATEEAKAIYRYRAATAEPVHGDLRKWRGFGQMPVRGKVKARAIALLMALTYDIIHAASLSPAA